MPAVFTQIFNTGVFLYGEIKDTWTLEISSTRRLSPFELYCNQMAKSKYLFSLPPIGTMRHSQHFQTHASSTRSSQSVYLPSTVLPKCCLIKGSNGDRRTQHGNATSLSLNLVNNETVCRGFSIHLLKMSKYSVKFEGHHNLPYRY